ncbi:mechanosensitive ion channel family protein [Tanticharoenia sakaeratensis]|uniref:MscS Mechanosensitive ion channel n=1 Tax=Tanticharoenia sakaeratensis NBRC 103193 TaxID=1231623 RepID=A0A0D6ML58_9PROT|nr:mechanosensitive ion channel domain-containing protein [Tanticharoenia sakaeratensis]GAN54008.1 MscS Mechanosensitive ion channel [Tanticharoenia sakaeratensis NBRC 103193]GBQ23101.1 mechanosensitive ion channel protein MscS [Tanticharoenia sakaeratensis NBRC 103193]
MLAGMLVFLALVFGGHDALAEPAATPSHAATTPANPHLSQAQAQQLLGVLDDPARRQQFETTLRNFAQAQGSAPATTAATDSSPTHVAAHAVRSNSLGAQILGGFGDLNHAIGAETHAILRTVVDFREVGPWVRSIRTSPGRRDAVLAVVLRAAVLAGVGAVLFVVVRLLLIRPRRHLSDRAQARDAQDRVEEHTDQRAAEDAADADAAASAEEEAADAAEAHAGTPDPATGLQAPRPEAAPAPAENPDEQKAAHQKAEDERVSRIQHQGALARLMRVIRRIPIALASLLLDLLPVAMVPLAAAVIGAFDQTDLDASSDVLRDLTLVAVAGGGLVAVARAVLAPKRPWLRLVIIHDAVSVFLFDWIRALAMVTSIGAAVVVMLSDCGLPDPVVIALLKMLALLVHGMIALMILSSRTHVMAFCRRLAHRRYASGIAIAVGRIWWIAALALDFGLWLVWAAEVRNGYAEIWLLFVRSIAALVIVRIISVALFGGLERGFRAVPAFVGLSEETRGRVARYYPALRQILRIAVALMIVLGLAIAWGVPFAALFGAHGLGSRVLGSLLTILIAMAIGAIVWEIANIGVERHIASLESFEDGKARVARVRTLLPMLRTILLVVLVAIIGLTALSEIGVNIGPLLAGASIFGVALGFGSQKLVQDFINGIFLLLENALTVGDAVTLNGTYGIVEHLSLRTVHVRANDGSMNIFPFSSLGQITNYNRDFARAIIVAEVAYDTDTDDVVKALIDVTADMRADPDFKDLIIADFILWGVDAFNDSSVTVRGTLPTTTQGRWPVQRQFNRRMKKMFEARGIVIPFPTRTLEIAGLDALVNPRPEVRHDDSVSS